MGSEQSSSKELDRQQKTGGTARVLGNSIEQHRAYKQRMEEVLREYRVDEVTSTVSRPMSTTRQQSAATTTTQISTPNTTRQQHTTASTTQLFSPNSARQQSTPANTSQISTPNTTRQQHTTTSTTQLFSSNSARQQSTPATTSQLSTPNTTRQQSAATTTTQISTPNTTRQQHTTASTTQLFSPNSARQQSTPANTSQISTPNTTRQQRTQLLSTNSVRQQASPAISTQLFTPFNARQQSTSATTSPISPPNTSTQASSTQLSTPNNARQESTPATTSQLFTLNTSRQQLTSVPTTQPSTSNTRPQLTSTTREQSNLIITTRKPTDNSTRLHSGLMITTLPPTSKPTPSTTTHKPTPIYTSDTQERTPSTTRQRPSTLTTTTLHDPFTSGLERQRTPYCYSQRDLHVAISANTYDLYPKPYSISPPGPNGQGSSSYNGQRSSNSNDQGPNNHSQTPASRNRYYRSTSRSHLRQGNKTNQNGVTCSTCGECYEDRIYLCNQGHSSCDSCKTRQVPCGKCRQQLTNCRNLDLEKYVSKSIVKCLNWNCIFVVEMRNMENHMKHCPFNVMLCVSLEDCVWSGKLSDLSKHFDESHPQHRKGAVNKEMLLSDICNTSKTMHLINLGDFNFLFHIEVSESEKRICMAVRLIGTKENAAKWNYEIHLYSKREPRRKFLFIDTCLAMDETIDEIVNSAKCAVIPLEYAKTFICNGELAYKIFIRKMIK